MSEWSFTPPGEVHETETAEGTAYERFRAGGPDFFAETAAALAREAREVWEREGRRMFITRKTVLGRMHQLKQAAWRGRQKRRQIEHDMVPEVEGVPWEPGDIF